MLLFEVEIPGRPGIKKNSKQIFRNSRTGRRFISTSNRFKDWEVKAIIAVRQAHSKFQFKKIEDYIRAEFVISLINHKHEPDCGNAIEGLCDVMEMCGVIKNDKLISTTLIEKVFGDKEFISVKLYLK